MMFTMKEIAVIHNTFLNVKVSKSLAPEDIENIMESRKIDLIELIGVKLGMLEAVECLTDSKYLVGDLTVGSDGSEMDMLTIGIRFKSKVGTFRDAAGNIRSFTADKGQYSVIKLANSIGAFPKEITKNSVPEPSMQPLELKPLHYNTALDAWGFGIPFEKKVEPNG